MTAPPSSANLTSFVGREAALAALRRAFADGSKLVTVTGAPGVGKTRLAAQFAAGEAGESAFCDLAGARDASGLYREVATPLGLPPGAGAAAIGRALRCRSDLLVVLDNLEHLLPWARRAVDGWVVKGGRASS